MCVDSTEFKRCASALKGETNPNNRVELIQMTLDNRTGRVAGTGQKLQLFSEIVACLTFLSTRLVSERCAPRGNLVGSVWRHFCFDALCIDNETALDSVYEERKGRKRREGEPETLESHQRFRHFVRY